MAKVLKSAKAKAKAKKTPGKGAAAKPNSRPREVAIREAARQFAAIEAKRQELNDAGKRITNMIVKGELGMSKKNFMVAYGQYLLDRNVVGVPGSGSAVRYVPPNKMQIGRP